MSLALAPARCSRLTCFHRSTRRSWRFSAGPSMLPYGLPKRTGRVETSSSMEPGSGSSSSSPLSDAAAPSSADRLRSRNSSSPRARLRRRCQRSATCRASGAPALAPSRQTFERSRPTTSTLGCCPSHRAMDSTECPSNRSTTRRRSRSTRMVPEAWPLLKPKSSTPTTRTSSPSEKKVSLMRFRRVSGLTSSPSSRARLAPQGEGDPLQGLPPAVGAAGTDAGHPAQPLGEDPALAGGFVAEELPYLQPQAHRGARPRQVGQRAGVVAMDPARGLVAHLTVSLRASYAAADGQQFSVEGEGVYVQSVGDGEAAVRVNAGHGVPPSRWRDCMGDPVSPKDRESPGLVSRSATHSG